MINIDYNNQTASKISAEFIEKSFSFISKYLQVKGDYFVSIAMISSVEMKKNNRIYSEINKTTDVLSFPEYETFTNVKKKTKFEVDLGEILICYEVAKKQAQSHKHSLRKEVLTLMTHGFLHLIGYDHQDEKQHKQMYGLQDKIVTHVSTCLKLSN